MGTYLKGRVVVLQRRAIRSAFDRSSPRYSLTCRDTASHVALTRRCGARQVEEEKRRVEEERRRVEEERLRVERDRQGLAEIER